MHWISQLTFSEFRIELWEDLTPEFRDLGNWRWTRLWELAEVVHMEPLKLLERFAQLQVNPITGVLIAVPISTGKREFSSDYRARLLRPRMDLPLTQAEPPFPYWTYDQVEPTQSLRWQEFIPCAADLRWFLSSGQKEEYPLYVSTLWGKAVLLAARKG